MVDGQKLMNRGQEVVASPTSGFFTRVNTKLISIQNLLSGTLAIQKSKLKQKKIKNQREKRERIEDRLEAPRAEKNKNIVSRVPRPGGMGILGWFKNFIGKILLGFFASRLLGSVGALEGILKGIAATVDVISTIGVGLVNGFATIVDFGYRAFDATKGFLRNVGGEDAVNAFETLMGKISTLIDILLLATLIKGSGDFGGPGRRPPRRRGGFGPGPRRPRPRGPGPRPRGSDEKPRQPIKPPVKPGQGFNFGGLLGALLGAAGIGLLGRKLGSARSAGQLQLPIDVPAEKGSNVINRFVRSLSRVLSGGGSGGRGPIGSGAYDPNDLEKIVRLIRKRSVKDLLTSKERISFLTERVARGESSPETFKKAIKELSDQGLLKPSDIRYFENMSPKAIEDSIRDTLADRPTKPRRTPLQIEIERLRNLKKKSENRNIFDRLFKRYDYLDELDADFVSQMTGDDPQLQQLARENVARREARANARTVITERIKQPLRNIRRRVQDAGSGIADRLSGTADRLSGLSFDTRLRARVATQRPRELLRGVKGFLSKSPLGKGIVGAFLDFGLSVLLGEDPGRAAFGAIGAGLGTAILAGLGSFVPGAGTLLGGFIGGYIGDSFGRFLYDMFFANKKPPAPPQNRDSDLGATPEYFLEHEYPYSVIPDDEGDPSNKEPTERKHDDPNPPGQYQIGDEVGSLFKVDPTLAARIRSLGEGYGDELFAADTLVIDRSEIPDQLPSLVASASIPTIVIPGSGYDAGQELYRS